MSKDVSVVGLDAILRELGAFGRYNIMNYALILFPCYLAGMYGAIYIFEAGDINYRCEVKQCESIKNDSLWLDYAIPIEKEKYSKCFQYASKTNSCTADGFNTNLKEKCSSFVYSDEDSIVKDFDLGCQNWKRTLVGTIHNSGLFISLPMTGIISDKFGRKKALSFAALMNCIFGFSRSFSTNYVMFLVLEFLEAGLGAGAYTTSFVIAMELVGPKGRVFGNTMLNTFYVFGLMSLAGLSWILQDWRKLLKIIYIPSCFVFTYLWILNESIRWLISKGRHEQALKVIKRAAKMNNVQISDQTLAPLQKMEEKPTEEKTEVGSEPKKSVFVQAMKSSIIRRRLLTCSFLWITCTFVYYGLSINSVSLAGNKYVNFMLVAFIEIPANFTCLLVLDKFGRKRVLIIMYILSAILCISLSFLPKDKTYLSLGFYLAGKFSITVAYSSVYIYVSEVFPTNVRQSLLATCSSTGRIGSTLAPLTPLLALYYESLPSIFFGTMTIIATMLVFTMPETINMPLPDSIEEAERLSKVKHRKTNA
ncbi:organic cation transporter protein-like [Spodoptera litura]|uniref:Organic cation transporter protein-like n=1 Tax=Spodoptera litura TaxID=69820 RepID=A0A9J7E9X4_SPOLT|nr:organic cation transporter protein-like [Spodoptera litura]